LRLICYALPCACCYIVGFSSSRPAFGDGNVLIVGGGNTSSANGFPRFRTERAGMEWRYRILLLYLFLFSSVFLLVILNLKSPFVDDRYLLAFTIQLKKDDSEKIVRYGFSTLMIFLITTRFAMNYSIIGNPTLGLVLLCLRMAFIIPSFLPSGQRHWIKVFPSFL